jgi:hypothetical protein
MGMGMPMRMGADLLHNIGFALGGAGGQGEVEVEFIGENIREGGGGPPAHHHHHHHHHHDPLQPPGLAAAAHLMEHFDFLDANPLANNPVEFNYGANGFNHEPPARPKPAHIAPPEAREGFTRDTGEDTVVICPNCEMELEYDPDADDQGPSNGQQPPPAKKARTSKKDREEHHFWAVKACGHVSLFHLPFDYVKVFSIIY